MFGTKARPPAREFADQVREHLPRLHRFALHLCRDPDVAYDCAQDAVVRAFERWDSYDPSRPLLPWLLTLVRNLCIDRARAFDPLRHGEGDEETERQEGGGDPLPVIVSAELGTLLDRALGTLPLEQRAAVLLYHVEGLTLEEIAGSEGVAVGTVKSRLFRGRKALAEVLSPVLDGDACVAGRAGGPAFAKVAPGEGTFSGGSS
jgi:RNA polymerase sigma-70 factor (ECF subfamily)